MKHFLSVHDVPDLHTLVHSAIAHKGDPHGHADVGLRRTLGLVFFNPSLRTRLSTQIAARNLGMEVVVLNAGQDAWTLETRDGVVMDGGASEHIREAAGVLGEYCDIIGVRAFPTLSDREADYNEDVLMKMVAYSGVPVVNLESATRHPLQSLADLVTIEELRTRARPKVVLTWAPHPKALPQSVPNSFVEWMRRADVDLVVTHPDGYELEGSFIGDAVVTHDQDAALDGADFVYAKNWSSYREYGAILSRDMSWTITPEKLARTREARFMHCLPVRRNMIVSDAVLDSPQSVVIREAGNRIWSAQAVLARLLEGLTG
jgi:N-succinyl-L-ornithine transcarbamylase